MSALRCFLAVPVPQDVKPRLVEVQRALEGAGAHGRWVPIDQLHLTLIFLGAIAAERLAMVSEALANAPALNPFPLQLGGLGCFGARRSPRVLWVGVHDASGRLVQLHQQSATALRKVGVTVESRPFHPHITLGRTRTVGEGRGLAKALRTVTFDANESWLVNEMRFYSSTLSSAGATHRLLQSFPLQA